MMHKPVAASTRYKATVAMSAAEITKQNMITITNIMLLITTV